MLALTGAAGFIARNLLPRLARRGESLLAVELPNRLAELNAHAPWVGSLAADAFLGALRAGELDDLDAIVHLGARTDTTDPDDGAVLENNYSHATVLMDAAIARGIRFIYASSAAVYGNSGADGCDGRREAPLNVYGFSKWLLDRHARKHLRARIPVQIAGVRPFNVYGPHEARKGRMASMVHQLADQLDAHGRMRLFGAGEGVAAGAHRRDFIHVDDLCTILLWLIDHPEVSGIYDAGSGESRTFNELAQLLRAARRHGTLEYLPFPEALHGRYQVATRADLGPLRSAGFTGPLLSLEDGVARYLARRDAAATPAVA